MGLSLQPHQEVLGFDVSVDEVLRMEILDPLEHLVTQHQGSLEGEFPTAQGMKII